MTPNDALILDTHALVWYLENDSRLSANVKNVFDSIESGSAFGIVPTIVLAELMHISEKRRITTHFETALDRIKVGTSE